MPNDKNPVVIIGGEGNGLGIARNLGSVGIDAYCLTSNRFDPTIFSKYCKGSSVIPGIEADPERLKTALHLVEKKLLRKGVLFPTSDTALLTLSSVINELDSYVSFIPDRKIIETLVLKKNFYNSLREHGVSHPITLYTDKADLDEIERKISFPVFIRPSQSAVFDKIFEKKGFIANSVGELRRYIKLADRHEMDVMIQEIIPGPTSNGYTIRGYFNKRSEPVVLFATQKIRQPSMFSNNTVYKSIPVYFLADFTDILVNYLKSIKYRGLFGAEIKRDSRNGAFKLLEINARSMSGNSFPFTCGANTILTAYLDSLGEEAPPVKDYKVGIYRINSMKDIKILVRMLVKGHFEEESWRKKMRPYFRKKVWSVFSLDDPMPFFINFYQSIEVILIKQSPLDTRACVVITD